MSLRKEEIEEIVREIIIGGGEHDIKLLPLITRVEGRLDVSLTHDQCNVVVRTMARCRMELENP